MKTRVLSLLAIVAVLVLANGRAWAERRHEPIHRAIEELREARNHLEGERRHEKVETAHRALKDAIRYVADTPNFGGERRERLIRRLDKLDRELGENWKNARPLIDEAIEDLEFSLR